MLHTLMIINFVLSQAFPSWSQQCAHDAGPPFEDSQVSESWHNGAAAQPVLSNGECADPLKHACSLRDAKTSYLEGPIDCGGNGWYCRILPDENWPSANLAARMNFDHCNTTESFESSIDSYQSGICHGSMADSTYYWLVRDYYFQQVAGRLRCCCDWLSLHKGGVVNSCNLRKEVGLDENIDGCIDANEHHEWHYKWGWKAFPYEGGCVGANVNGIGQPIPEDDSQCWEVNNFGIADVQNIPEENQNNFEEAEDVEEENAEESKVDLSVCTDDTTFRFRRHRKKSCRWVAANVRARCQLRINGGSVSDKCPLTCGKCSHVQVPRSPSGRRRKN